MAVQERNSEMVSLLSADFIQKQDSAYIAGIVTGTILTLPGLIAFWPGGVMIGDGDDVQVPSGASFYVGGPTPGGYAGVRLHYASNQAYIDVKDGDLNIRIDTSTGGTTRAVFLNSGGLLLLNTTAPGSNGSGAVIYAESGALKVVGSSGTVTTLGVA